MPEIKISSMTLGPFGVGHLDGRTVMVPNAVPGDRLEVVIEDERRGYALGRIARVVSPSLDRRLPPCPYLPRCGGCDWQQIAWAAQLRLKGELVAAELNRALGSAIEPTGLVEAAPQEFHYRSRIRLKTGPGGALGFHEAASNRLVEIEQCLVGPLNLKLPGALALALGRHCEEIEAASSSAGEVLVAHLKQAPAEAQVSRARRVMAEDHEIVGIVLRGGAARIRLGDPEIAVEIEPGLELRVDADLFTQVNHAHNRRLVAAVIELAAPAADVAVLDLFCGAGNFSLPAARRGAKVTGVDSQAAATDAARRNAHRLGLGAAQFLALSAQDTARFLLRARYRAEAVILDPPRTGAADLMELILRLRAPSVLYVSCNAATLARDLRILAAGGYRLKNVRGFDFFPNTHHVEVLAHMVLT